MTQAEQGGILAIDVGSSRTKLGWFPPASACTDKPATALPIAGPKLVEPAATMAVEHGDMAVDTMVTWLESEVIGEPRILVASVRPKAEAALEQACAKLDWQVPQRLQGSDLPLEVQVEFPERVGIDRLLNAAGANRLRDPAKPAIVVDIGTAITVDLVLADGAFQGGAIMPGMTLASKSLNKATASLPDIDFAAITEPIEAVGKNTEQAITSGIHWGTVGAISELMTRMAQQCETAPQLFVTGGGAAAVAPHLGTQEGPANYVPHLTLSAICASVEDQS